MNFEAGRAIGAAQGRAGDDKTLQHDPLLPQSCHGVQGWWQGGTFDAQLHLGTDVKTMT